ncbi:methyltransferase-UbiE [Capsaspora owczarzaki ATCC 30864]|uniref:methyltransferase-UbiE n=1 Tax=Capsaspora owczarzaki (strain ATCC 30864) TaxID=595528 RepID=UPI0003523EF8|nr:methyltransferase-UbiE [Capsaspora owczarzaki ATCC 30864]|eukprot:XP_004342776.2 methyltransferase-UbiE [Capsaspora owczarzaki ATCC 30864]
MASSDPVASAAGSAMWSDKAATARMLDFLNKTNTDAAAVTLKRRTYDALLTPLLAANPAAPLSVLDVGCGAGHSVIAIAALLPAGSKAVGVDFNEAFVKQGGELAAAQVATGLVRADVEIVFAQADAQDLSQFKDASFDAVRTERVLQHLADPLKALREMARVLRPGGRLVVTEGNKATISCFAEDPFLVEMHIKTLANMSFAQDSIGTRVPLLVRQELGFSDVHVQPEVLLLTSPQQVDPGLKRAQLATESLVTKGTFTREECDRYIQTLLAAKEFEVMYSSTWFVTSSTKPSSL